MTQSTNNFSNARDASRARRKALSQSGKSAISPARTRAPQKQMAGSAPAATAIPQAGANPTIGGTGASGKVASGKAASIARRLAMSSRGKAGVVSSDRTREDEEKLSASRNAAPAPTTAEVSDKKATCGCGCNGEKQECKTQIADTGAVNNGTPMMNSIRRQPIKMSSGRAASYARREAMSKRGKAGISSKGLSAAQTARAANPNLSTRELAMTLREQRSRQGRCGEKKSEPCGRVRPIARKNNAAAQDAPWKVGASETSHGQTLTGTMVGRSSQVTGDEPSTCRDVTGTEYMGAEMFRDFCQVEPVKAVRKVNVTSTMHGNAVSGNKIGRGENVTGNEAGSCKNVTGNEYLSSIESETFCGSKSMAGPRKVSVVETGKSNTLTGSNVGRSEKVTGDEPGSDRLLTGSQYTQPVESAGDVPGKVGLSQTLRGGSVSGTLLDRTQHVTGNEAGTCRNVTGDDYLSREQFKGFCENVPQPTDNKVEVSETGQGNAVTGVMTSRSQLVTGNEPGTCKSVTGTPYASADQSSQYCGAEEISKIDARTPAKRTFAGSAISGIQPAVGGTMTGDSKGACEPVSGTPYIGADQLAQMCPSQPADVHSADFPQPLAFAGAIEKVPAMAPAPVQMAGSAVTGSSYGKGNITGPFGMADGKVTGTEQARFGNNDIAAVIAAPVMPVVDPMVEGRVKSRISGEGMDAGKKITGDDWDRGEHVTGTEGTSATQRNPTFHGVNARAASSVSVMKAAKRNDDVPVPVSKVTGSSGNSADGSLVTYSGGARG